MTMNTPTPTKSDTPIYDEAWATWLENGDDDELEICAKTLERRLTTVTEQLKVAREGIDTWKQIASDRLSKIAIVTEQLKEAQEELAKAGVGKYKP